MVIPSRIPRTPAQTDPRTARALARFSATMAPGQFFVTPATTSGPPQFRPISVTDLGTGSSTSHTLLHGNLTWGAVDLATETTGVAPVAAVGVSRFLQSGTVAITGTGTVTTTFATGITSATCTIKTATLVDPALVSCTFSGNTLTIYTWTIALVASATAATIDWIATGN